MSYTLLGPDGTAPFVYTGPEGSPNGVLTADVGTLVMTTDSRIYVKTVGSDDYGWTEIPQGD